MYLQVTINKSEATFRFVYIRLRRISYMISCTFFHKSKHLLLLLFICSTDSYAFAGLPDSGMRFAADE